MDTDQILIEKFIREYPLEAAHAIEKLSDEEVAVFIDKIPVDRSGQIISQMQNFKAARCLQLINHQLAIQILEKLDLNETELILRQCNKTFFNNMLNGLPENQAVLLREKLSYPANSVGAFMKPMVLGFKKEITVQDTIEKVKLAKEQLSSLIFVIDAERKLEGIVKIHDLLSHESSVTLSVIMIDDVPKFFADTSIESVADHPCWYEYHDIPVVDKSERLIGTLQFKSTRKNKKSIDGKVTNDIAEASNALGELYRIGLTGFLQSVGK